MNIPEPTSIPLRDTPPVKTLTEKRLDALEATVSHLRHLVEELNNDITDQKEAFEHTDDSVQKLRTTVSTITGG